MLKKAQRRMVAAGFSLRANDERKLILKDESASPPELATTKSLRATRSNLTTQKRILPVLIAAIFFLNQINLSAAGILDYVDEPQKSYEEMMTDDLKADMYISNLNAVIGGENRALLTNTGNYIIQPGQIDLKVNSDSIGTLPAGAYLIFSKNGTDDDTSDDRLVSVILPGNIRKTPTDPDSPFSNIVQHSPSKLNSFTLNNDRTSKQIFSDGTELEITQTGSGTNRTYSIKAGEKSSLTTMRLKDASSMSLVRGANVTGIQFSDSLSEGFNVTDIMASKGTISWKKKAIEGVGSDIELAMKDKADVVQGKITIKSGTSFTTKDGAFLESKQGAVIMEIYAGKTLGLADGTKIKNTGAINNTITITHGRWDLKNFQGTIELGGKSTGMVFDGVNIKDGAEVKNPIKLTTSSNANFTLLEKGVLNTDLSASKGALTFTIDGQLSADTTFKLEAARSPGADKKWGTIDDLVTTMDLTVPAVGHKSTQFTIENAKFKSSTEGALKLTMPTDYAHVLKDDTKGNFVVVMNGSNYDVNDRGITFANGLRFIYDVQDKTIDMTVNSNGRYTVTSKPKDGAELVIVTNSNSAFAQFNVNNIKVTPRYGFGGAFGITSDNKIDVTLEDIIQNDRLNDLNAVVNDINNNLLSLIATEEYMRADPTEKLSLLKDEVEDNFVDNLNFLNAEVTPQTLLVEGEEKAPPEASISSELKKYADGVVTNLDAVNGEINEVLSQHLKTDLNPDGDITIKQSAEIYNTGEITLEFPGDTKSLALKQFTIISKDEEISKIIVKDSPGQSYAQVDFANVSGKFKIDVTAGTPQFALKDGISVTAVSGALPSFNIDSGNLDLAKTPVADGGQTGQIQVSLANTKEAIAAKTFTTFNGLQVTLNKLAEGEPESSFKLQGIADSTDRGMELALSGVNPLLSSANFSGSVNITVPGGVSLRTFVLSDSEQSSFTVDTAGGEASFKLVDGNFVSSSAKKLEFTLKSGIAVTIDKDVSIARTAGFTGNPAFDLVNGKLDFYKPINPDSSPRTTLANLGNTTLNLGATAPQITITQSDRSILTVGPGQRTVDFINGEVARASVTVFPGTSRKMAEGVTFLNPNPVPRPQADPPDPRYELHIGNDTQNQWDFASSDNYPFESVERAAAVPITITVDDAKTTADQVFKLRADGDNIPDITITVDKEKSASFKVNADGTFGGWLSGEFKVTIENNKSLVIGSATDNVTLLAGSGQTSFKYTNNGILMSYLDGDVIQNFNGTVTLTKAPASKFVFKFNDADIVTEIKSFETLGGMDFSFGVSGGIPDAALISNGEIKIQDKSTITLDNGVALAAAGTDASVKFRLSDNAILGSEGKLTVTNKGSSAAIIKRTGKFDLTTNADSGFTVDLTNNNDNLSSLSGNITLDARADLTIDGAQGTVGITTNGKKITLNKVEITGSNFNLADAKIDFKTTTFTGNVNFLAGAPAATFVLYAPDVPAGIELTATNGAFKVASGVLDADETAGADYISKNNFKLPAKSTLKINDMTFEAMGPAIKTVSVYIPPSPPSGDYTGYDLTAIGGTASDDKVVVKIANATEIKVFKLNGAELTIEAGKSASFTVKADGTLGKYESGDITVKLLGTSPVSAVIGDVTVTGTANDTFKLANGKFDLKGNISNLTITVAASAPQAFSFLLAQGIELVAKAKTLTPSSFTVSAGGVLTVPTLSGAFTVTLPANVELSGLTNVTKVKAIKGAGTFDLTGATPDSLDKSRGTLEIEIANGQTVSLAQSMGVISWSAGAKVRIVNGKFDTYMSGKVQFQMAETAGEAEGTPDTTIKFDINSGFGTDSQVLYKKGAAGSFMIDNTGGTPLVNFSENGSGIFEVKLKGTGTDNIPKVVLMNAEITPIAVGLTDSEAWLTEMIVKNKKLAATSKGDLRVKILTPPTLQDAFKFKMLDGTKILAAPVNTEFRISNGRYGGLITLPTPGFEIELGSILTHTWWPFNSPDTKFEMKYIQGTKLRYEVFPDPDVEGAFLPTVLNTDAGSVPGVVIMKALQNVVIDGLGMIPATGIMVFKNNVLQSDEYYYALKVE